ncbi:MAG: amino acid permease [Vampirovibrio sp.]|nr:amino acid permease [Vampirovibrio sp.]
MTSPEPSQPQVLRTKPLQVILKEAESHHGGLKKVLSAFDLTALGVGAVIGAGIFVLTGAASQDAGPAVTLSFTFAGLACIFAALCYAEFAARIPIAGSAYTYAYASLGELVAWIIGWDLVLEYTIGAATVAQGWSGYISKVFEGFGLDVPAWLTSLQLGPFDTNPMAAAIIVLLTGLLCIGIKESARFNAVMVAVKLAVVLFIIALGSFYVNPDNWLPGGTYFPMGFGGVFTGAATVFFAYIGFDAVSTAAEEVKNPKRDLPIGIIASLLICTLLYILVSAVITGMVPYEQIDLKAPLASAFGDQGLMWAQTLISVGAFAGLTTVILVLLMSQPRIYFAMARDGLLPQWFGRIHPVFGTPMNASIVTGIIGLTLAFFFDIGELAEMVAIGTLFAFSLACGGVLVLRYKGEPEKDEPQKELRPNRISGLVMIFAISSMMSMAGFLDKWPWPLTEVAFGEEGRMAIGIVAGLIALVTAIKIFCLKAVDVPQTFACPFVPAIPLMGIVANMTMMLHLPAGTWLRLWIWLGIGLLIYFLYGLRHSNLAKE